MTEPHNRNQMDELASAQMNFKELTKILIDGMSVLADRVANWTNHMGTVNETMHEYSDLAKELLDTHRAMLAAVSEMQVAINENTARLDAVILRFESYFGSGPGLEYDN
ncbi:MAG: hypothetical protein QOK48_88 [Blastocatellia bacterium]|nr:hypothetical protein [Blastocatellia bacterium]